MLHVENNHIEQKSLIDVINKYGFLGALQEAIDEYIIDNKQRTIIDGEPKEVFYISGLAKQHHEALADYLNATVLKTINQHTELAEGYFADFPAQHYWLKLNDLIIDLALRQFYDKDIVLSDNLKQLLDHKYFICDNPDNHFYQLYKH